MKSGGSLNPAQKLTPKIRRQEADGELEVWCGFQRLSEARPTGSPSCETTSRGPRPFGFDFEKAFGLPIKIVNDAAMEAVGSSNTARCSFWAWGLTLGSALVIGWHYRADGTGHLPYRKGVCVDYIGAGG